MRKVYLVKNYKWGEPIFATDTKDDAIDLAKTLGVAESDIEEDLDKYVIEAVYVEGEKRGR